MSELRDRNSNMDKGSILENVSKRLDGFPGRSEASKSLDPQGQSSTVETSNSETDQVETIPRGNTNPPRKLDPQNLFELVSKHYDSWLHVLNKQFEDEENFLPFPNEDRDAPAGLGPTRGPGSGSGPGSDSQQPIFNYSLLEALERASSEFARDLEELRQEVERAVLVDERVVKEALQVSLGNKVPSTDSSEPFDRQTLLQELEINYLQDKIVQIFQSNDVNMPRNGLSIGDGRRVPGDGEAGGVEGVVGGGSNEEGNSQDDYDISELLDSLYNDYRPTHHIEVELNTGPAASRKSGTRRTVFNNEYDFDQDGEGPSCEFTFEYDHNGKLVPTHNNVEEKLRLMSLQSRMGGAVPMIAAPTTSSKRKKKKKKGKLQTQLASGTPLPAILSVSSGLGTHVPPPHAQPLTHLAAPNCCLFCEYETIYGFRPRQMIKWYDQTMRREELRREEIRKKLESAKLKALKKQRELRQRQQQQLQDQAENVHQLTSLESQAQEI